ncbi:hypothetical protein LshimejAT787_0100250 [Lyophyllum shimeji]|uniref:Uncharacterized protein n=1 Tax=Lyophyllum shimeji TaxID=47721 RepID=A0A9P3PC40_LYOSH|nr:hypothetical protein LshimejAT787_0100250 [Lyophyllum shimeji]
MTPAILLHSNDATGSDRSLTNRLNLLQASALQHGDRRLVSCRFAWSWLSREPSPSSLIVRPAASIVPWMAVPLAMLPAAQRQGLAFYPSPCERHSEAQDQTAKLRALNLINAPSASATTAAAAAVSLELVLGKGVLRANIAKLNINNVAGPGGQALLVARRHTRAPRSSLHGTVNVSERNFRRPVYGLFDSRVNRENWTKWLAMIFELTVKYNDQHRFNADGGVEVLIDCVLTTSRV